nr:retrovirus-related Pol polyprotein from transposon TNT 1-94 [Tanacetum cinerariifolium]
MKGIKKEFNVPRTPQQNGIAERKNRTLIEAARTMLADSLLPIPFWAEAVNTACYVQNRVLVTKPQNKTPYELLLGRTHSIGFMRPFACLVTILNTLDPLGKFDGKADEGFLVGYSNTDDATFEVKEPEFEGKNPESKVHVSPSSSAKTKKHDDKTKREAKGKSAIELATRLRNLSEEFEDFSDNSINEVNADDTLVLAVGQISTNNTNTFSPAGPSNTANRTDSDNCFQISKVSLCTNIFIIIRISLESVEDRLVVYQKNETVFEEDIKLLKRDVMLRDNVLAKHRKKFEKVKKEINDLKHTLDKFQTSSKNLSKLLESQVSDKTGLGFNSQVFNCQVSNYEELHSYVYDNRVPKNPKNDRYKTGEGYHVVPPPYTGTFLPPKPDLVFTDNPNASESVANVFNVESSINKSSKDMS